MNYYCESTNWNRVKKCLSMVHERLGVFLINNFWQKILYLLFTTAKDFLSKNDTTTITNVTIKAFEEFLSKHSKVFSWTIILQYIIWYYFELQNRVENSSHTSALVSITTLKSSYQIVVFILILPFTINIYFQLTKINKE